MLPYLSRTFLTLTLVGGAVTLLVFLVCRLAGPRLSARWRYAIWILPALLFVLPLPLSTPPLTEAPAPATSIVAARPEQSAALPSSPAAENTEAALPHAPALSHTDVPLQATLPMLREETDQLPALPLPALWALGVAALTLWHTLQALHFQRFMKRKTIPAEERGRARLEQLRRELGIRRRVGLRRFSCPGSPFLAGLLRPTIYLPETPLTPAELDCVLRHELIHCRRLDLLWKRLLRFVRVLHWCNPAAWLMEREAGRYCELSCDEAVAAPLNREERRAYGMAILKLMKGSPAPATPCLAEREIKHRLEDMMNLRKKGRLARLLAIALAAALCLGGAAAAVVLARTNPAGIYETGEFTGISLSIDREERLNEPESIPYVPGTGSSNAITGTARLVDRPGERSFSADLQVADLVKILYGRDHHSGPHHIQVEMTELHSAVEAVGTWTGRFTVKRDGEVIYENTKGRITNVPSLTDGAPAGLTQLFVERSNGNWFTLTMNYGVDGTALVDAAAREEAADAALENDPDTRRLSLQAAPGNQVAGYEIKAAKSPPVYAGLFMNDRIKTAYLSAGLTPVLQPSDDNGSWYWNLTLAPEDVTSYAPGRLEGTFFLMDNKRYDDYSFLGVASGLDGAVGDPVTVQSNDGKFDFSFILAEVKEEPDEKTMRIESGGRRGSLEMDMDAYNALLARSNCGWFDDMTLDELPFEVSWDPGGVTVRCTAGKESHWTAMLFNWMGDRYYAGDQYTYIEGEGASLGYTPFQGAYRQRYNKTGDNTIYLPFSPDGGQDEYHLYLGLWSVADGVAAGADYELEFHRGAARVLPISCRMRDGVRLETTLDEPAIPFLKQFLPEYVFDETDWRE